jgi:hypothetical protein
LQNAQGTTRHCLGRFRTLADVREEELALRGTRARQSICGALDLQGRPHRCELTRVMKIIHA